MHVHVERLVAAAAYTVFLTGAVPVSRERADYVMWEVSYLHARAEDRRLKVYAEVALEANTRIPRETAEVLLDSIPEDAQYVAEVSHSEIVEEKTTCERLRRRARLIVEEAIKTAQLRWWRIAISGRGDIMIEASTAVVSELELQEGRPPLRSIIAERWDTKDRNLTVLYEDWGGTWRRVDTYAPLIPSALVMSLAATAPMLAKLCNMIMLCHEAVMMAINREAEKIAEIVKIACEKFSVIVEDRMRRLREVAHIITAL